VQEDGMHIVPLIVGDERVTMGLCQGAIEQGVFAQAIRPPTVAAGTSRLRLTAMASHTPDELSMAARVLGDVVRAMGLDPESIGQPVSERRVPELEPSFAGSELSIEEAEPFFGDVEPSTAELEEEVASAARSVGRERLAAAVRSRLPGPFDAERPDGAIEDEVPAPLADEMPAATSAASAPFDIERETTAVPRAA
jgi:hypothetical protein